MNFDSLSFLLFFGLVLLVRYLPFNWTARKIALVAFSYAFYSLWNVYYLGLLLFSTTLDYFLARMISGSTSDSRRRVGLWLSLAGNFGVLAFFKYFDFASGSLVSLAGAAGVHFTAPTFDVLLPIGISFYTFQTVSYVIDVYRGQRTAHENPVDFALYVSFFPQLVAGPIVRSDVFLSQCARPEPADFKRISLGLHLFAIGLLFKMIFADRLMAPIVDRVYGASAEATFDDVVFGTLAFSNQIYFDFAGYSTCAIGLALALGFRLPENFMQPYGARSFAEFWNRWHISLSTWLRDYLYIPLGGNRFGKVRMYHALIVTMLLGGLWHGAAWNFVIWGGLHGLFLIGERALGLRIQAGARTFWLASLTRWFYTMLGVNFAWIFFRSPTFADAMHMLGALGDFSGSRLVAPGQFLLALVVTGAVYIVHWRARDVEWSRCFERLGTIGTAVSFALILIILIFFGGASRPFVYFQF